MDVSYSTKRRRIRAKVEERLTCIQNASGSPHGVLEESYNQINPAADTSIGLACASAPCSFDGIREVDSDSRSSGQPRLAIPPLHDIDITETEFEQDSSSENENSGREENDMTSNELMGDQLAEWAVTFQITHVALLALLNILRTDNPNLPKDPRTLLHTLTRYDIKQIKGGQYFHFGLANGIMKYIANFHSISSVSFQVNIDGLPVFKSTPMQFWPILCKLVDPVVQEPFVIGLYYGSSKPEQLEEYLQDFVDELQLLQRDGILHEGKRIDVKLSCVICDTPARSYVKKTKGHMGYAGCDKCTQKGEWVGRMTFPDVRAPPRTDVQFDDMSDEEHHTGTTPFSRLSIGMVSQFPLDYMHLVCLGVMKKVLLLWIRGPVSIRCRIGSNAVNHISERLEYYRSYIPREFCRKGRGLKEVDRWKATEFRLFLLYTGPVSLSGIVSSSMYKNFLLLFVGIFCLASPHLCREYCEYANDILCLFVQNFASLYGNEMLVYNVHGLTHLAADVQQFGPLDSFSGFAFENFLGKIKRLIRTPTSPLQQVIRRFSERQTDTIPTCSERYHIGTLKREHGLGPLMQGVDTHSQYKELHFQDYMISNDNGNNCIKIGDDIVLVRNIIMLSDCEINVIYEKFTKLDDYFAYPLPSSQLGILKVSKLSGRLKMLPATQITCKYVLLPYKQSYISIPLLHIG